MANKGLGLLLAGGAALVLMSGGKKKKKSKRGGPSGQISEDPKKVDVVSGHHLKTASIPVPKPPAPSAQSPTEKQKGRQQDLNLLGYQFPVTGIDDENTRRATMEFQYDWNDFVEILRAINPNIDYREPYNNISVDGKWGPQTQSRVDKARNKFDGNPVYIDELDRSVRTFREMVTGLRNIPENAWAEEIIQDVKIADPIKPKSKTYPTRINVPGTSLYWVTAYKNRDLDGFGRLTWHWSDGRKKLEYMYPLDYRSPSKRDAAGFPEYWYLMSEWSMTNYNDAVVRFIKDESGGYSRKFDFRWDQRSLSIGPGAIYSNFKSFSTIPKDHPHRRPGGKRCSDYECPPLGIWKISTTSKTIERTGISPLMLKALNTLLTSTIFD